VDEEVGREADESGDNALGFTAGRPSIGRHCKNVQPIDGVQLGHRPQIRVPWQMEALSNQRSPTPRRSHVPVDPPTKLDEVIRPGPDDNDVAAGAQHAPTTRGKSAGCAASRGRLLAAGQFWNSAG